MIVWLGVYLPYLGRKFVAHHRPSLEKTGKFGKSWRVDRGGGADVVGGEVSIGW